MTEHIKVFLPLLMQRVTINQTFYRIVCDLIENYAKSEVDSVEFLSNVRFFLSPPPLTFFDLI